MHELAITESIVAGVRERLGDVPVIRVILEIGALAAIDAQAVRFCFDLCARDTPLEGAELEIVDIPGRGQCRSCAAEFDVANLVSTCVCGSLDIEIRSGESLRVRAVEVA